LGAGGQLGKELSEMASVSGFNVVACDRQTLDITDANAALEKIKNELPDCVVNAAAYTAVDKAESDAENAYLINETGAKNIAEACQAASIPLIHISTDYVFNGQKDSPYNEKDTVDPQSVYGLSKYKGEQAVRETLDKHIILRVSWVFGLHGNNFVKSILRLASERDELNIVADQLGCPTSTVNIANVILQIVPQICDESFKQKNFGTYHYCDAPETTWFGFASAIVEAARAEAARAEAAKAEALSAEQSPFELKVKQIIPIMTHEYPTPAKRPVNSRLDTALIEKTFGVKRAEWRPELDKLIQKLIVLLIVTRQ
ncbi:MAG: dTDP-4-dehydrorhamnose reductase, partial [Gammaproteobacteria bacterium]|nr:dTDP-4-dehydrorhamnose reductase [Gammaproteobacteria bacterium]